MLHNFINLQLNVELSTGVYKLNKWGYVHMIRNGMTFLKQKSKIGGSEGVNIFLYDSPINL